MVDGTIKFQCIREQFDHIISILNKCESNDGYGYKFNIDESSSFEKLPSDNVEGSIQFAGIDKIVLDNDIVPYFKEHDFWVELILKEVN
jgi:hypothetical protein